MATHPAVVCLPGAGAGWSADSLRWRVGNVREALSTAGCGSPGDTGTGPGFHGNR